MKVYTLFNDETQFFEQIVGLRQQVAAAGKGRPAGDPLQKQLADFDRKLDKIRKEIVATKEGGAITGEERLREHTDQLYGAITSWEGPPSAYQLDNIAGLRSQLSDATDEFSKLTSKELPALNAQLKAKGGPALGVPAPAAFDDEAARGGGGRPAGGQRDHDAAGELKLPADFRLWN